MGRIVGKFDLKIVILAVFHQIYESVILASKTFLQNIFQDSLDIEICGL